MCQGAIELGVHGLADALIMKRLAFESHEAHELNKSIFETMYNEAIRSSIDLAKVDAPYKSFKGSPTSKGKYHFHLWGVSPSGRCG